MIILSLSKLIGNIVYRLPDFIKSWLENVVFLCPQENLPNRHTGTHVGVILGGGSGRIEKALELYKQGYIDYFLVSGGIGPYSENQSEAEAEGYANKLIAAGVPDNRIWIENRSTNTVENIQFSMEILARRSEQSTYGFIHPIIITSGYHLKRAHVLFEAALARVRRSSPNGCSIAHSYWSASPFGICELDTWRLSADGCARVVKEAIGLFVHRLTGKI